MPEELKLEVFINQGHEFLSGYNYLVQLQIKQAPKGHGSDFFKDCPLYALC